MANQPKKYKKFVATAATATLVASAIVPVASAASLSDIKGNTHEEAITSLVDAGVINGYPDGTFQPNKTLTRSDVVKLLGKYLESKGHEVPSDYKTNVRFNDLTTASNDELLKYAAVVYDAGVFNGSNGNLLAGDNITRENMAVVLVRAFDTLNNIDLVSYVQGQEYKKDVKDLFTAKSEARTAIEVLDFFDITNPAVANFNPKGSTTRGQFATFLYKTINTDFSAVTGVANSAVSEIKAINNTTVEVTFKEAVDNKEALDFTIDGLEVKNAVVKQTDAKTVVLTTAPQTGDKVYTLNVNAAKAGTFKGISAVVPEKIEFTTESIQGVYGQQVTVSAKVTVPQGQSAAGVSVTFNIDSNKDAAGGQFAKDYTAEAFTNESGVATYTYTQYNPSNSEDSVTAYATGKANVRAYATVYWGNAARLTVTDVTTGSSIANSATKVYQVKSTENKNGFVFVTFKENKGVTPDKVTNGVTFTDANVYRVDANGNFSPAITNGVPFEVTTGGHQVAVVKLNAEGVGNFTLTGADATVTPVVYAGKYTTNTAGNAITVSTDAKHDGTDLQAVASPAVFSLSQVADMTIVAEGKANAAARNADSSSATAGVGTGGREYKITLKGKDGKVAPANTDVVVFFEQATTGNSNRVNHNVTLVSDDVTHTVSAQPTGSTNLNAGIKLKTNKKGEIEFSVHGANNDFVTPIAVYDNGKTANVLDTSDLKVVGETTYFGAAEIGGSRIDILDENGKVVDDSTVTSNEATIRYVAVDQNGFDYYNASSREFDATFVLSDAFTAYNTNATEISKENNRTTYKVKAVNGVATLKVTKTSTGAGQVSYTASTTNNIVAPQSGVVEFGTAADRAIITGKVTGFDTTKNEVTLIPTNSTLPVTLSYAGADWFYKGSAAGVTEAYFESKLAVGVEITYNKATETTKAKFDITKDAAGDVVDAVNASVNAAQVKQALLAGGYTGYSTLPTTIQNAVAATLYGTGTTIHANQTALDTAYANALDTAVTNAITTADTTAVAAGNAAAGTAFTTAYTAFVDAVKEVPGSSTVVSKLLALNTDAIKDTVATAVGALTPDTTKTAAEDAAAYVASIQAEIDKALAAAAQQPLTNALTAINAATSGTNLLTALQATNTADTTKTNAQVLGLDLTKVATTDLTALANEFYGNKPAGTNGYTTLNIADSFDKAVAWVNDKTAPTVKSAVYTAPTGSATTGTLVLTFSEDVTAVGGTIALADIEFGTAGSTVAAEALTATLTDSNTLTITISAAAIADGFKVGQDVKVTLLETAGSAATVTLEDDSLTGNTYVPAVVGITAPVTP